MKSRFCANIPRLKKHLRQGGLLAYPTESCYGLGCLPNQTRALRRLIYLKKRPANKGFISIACHIDQFRGLIDRLPEKERAMLNQQWPAAKTYLLPAKSSVPILLRGKGRNKIAVRIPDHALARMLCKKLQTALVSTSANRHKGKVCRHEREVRHLFGRRVMVVGGRVGRYKKPSQIIDFKTQRTLRSF